MIKLTDEMRDSLLNRGFYNSSRYRYEYMDNRVYKYRREYPHGHNSDCTYKQVESLPMDLNEWKRNQRAHRLDEMKSLAEELSYDELLYHLLGWEALQ